MRRTTLSWAAQRGDHNAVELLLMRGADPNKPDNSLRTPLHWSAVAKTHECALLLLQYDAKVDVKDDLGRTTLSRVASNNHEDDTLFVETLVNFGADVDTEDEEGWRPLHWAAHIDQSFALSRLLDHHANSNATDKLGRSPLQVAILRNCHKVLRVLVGRSALGGSGKTALGSTILHCAADNADIETLSILQFADLRQIDPMERNIDSLTALDIAQLRRDHNMAWAESSCQARDDDPLQWYRAFETFLGLSTSCSKTSSWRAEVAANYSTEWQIPEESDGCEVWEDAVEIQKCSRSLPQSPSVVM